MLAIITWLMERGLSKNAAKAVLAVSGAILLVLGGLGLKSYYDHKIISRHDDKVNVEILQKQAPANDKAAEARASDIINLHSKSEGRQNAIAKEKSTTPTDADLALNCHRLREAGYDTSSFPSCSGR